MFCSGSVPAVIHLATIHFCSEIVVVGVAVLCLNSGLQRGNNGEHPSGKPNSESKQNYRQTWEKGRHGTCILGLLSSLLMGNCPWNVSAICRSNLRRNGLGLSHHHLGGEPTAAAGRNFPANIEYVLKAFAVEASTFLVSRRRHWEQIALRQR